VPLDALGLRYSEATAPHTGHSAAILLHGPYIGSTYSTFFPSASNVSEQSKHLNSIILIFDTGFDPAKLEKPEKLCFRFKTNSKEIYLGQRIRN
jgi:hypothetical protein